MISFKTREKDHSSNHSLFADTMKNNNTKRDRTKNHQE